MRACLILIAIVTSGVTGGCTDEGGAPDVDDVAAREVAPQPKSECRKHDPPARIQPTWQNAKYPLPGSHGIAYHPELGLGIVSIPNPGTQEVALMDPATGTITKKFAFHRPADKDAYSTPRGLFIDPQKRVLVPLSYHHTLRVFDKDGSFIKDYAPGSLGYAPDASTSDKWIAVANASKGVDLMALDGSGHKKITDVLVDGEDQKLPGGYGVRFDLAGNLWLGAQDSNSVVRIDAAELANRKPKVKYIEVKPGLPDRMGPYGLAFDKFGDLYVSFHSKEIRRLRVAGDTATLIETIPLKSVRHLVVVGCDVYFADYKTDYGVLRESGPAADGGGRPPGQPEEEDEVEEEDEAEGMGGTGSEEEEEIIDCLAPTYDFTCTTTVPTCDLSTGTWLPTSFENANDVCNDEGGRCDPLSGRCLTVTIDATTATPITSPEELPTGEQPD